MNQTEYAELLRYIRTAMVGHDLAALDARIVSDIEGQDLKPSDQLLRYLELLEAEMRLGSGTTAGVIVQRLRSSVRTESGEPIEGIELRIDPADIDLFGAETVDLGGAPDLTDLLLALEALRHELHEDEEPA